MRHVTTPTPEQIAKLPKYAQDYISTLESRAEVAEERAKGLFDAQEITPISFEPTIALDTMPRFLKGEPGGSGMDYSQVKFWLFGTRWHKHATRDYFEVTRGFSAGGRFSRSERENSQDDAITVRAADGRITVEPMSSSEVALRYQRYV